VAPKDEKFRKIKLSNKKITENVVNATGAMDAMKELGWVVSEENSDELVIPEGVYFTMKEVSSSISSFQAPRAIQQHLNGPSCKQTCGCMHQTS
jgi:hypothetical protein